ncbi:MAG: hypothetical protein KJZ78_02065 [Bryobacteraceae bacterium]|nr:hypothetical protein [Bryobacteraceae bacterium]
MLRFLPFLVCLASHASDGQGPFASARDASEYARRVKVVRAIPGFIALWDFVLREPGNGRFLAHQAAGVRHNFALEAVNYVREYWNEGRAAAYNDFPLLNRGPFGQAVRFLPEPETTFRPTLLVPRARFHDSRLDVKGPGRSVSLAAWVVRESGNHAIAGIWHEGTDLRDIASPARRVERGKRQYALFAGLAANHGASAAHVSENGTKSFGDRYARNLAVTPNVIPTVPPGATVETLDRMWSVAGFVFDNEKNTVTAYLNGNAKEYWIDNPASHPFFQWPAKGWLQAQLRKMPGTQPGEDPEFPTDQFYTPPETKLRERRILETTETRRIELHTFDFTKVHITLHKDSRGRFTEVVSRELVALRVNPFWFHHDLYSPGTPDHGGPFTIGRVIHSGRSVGFTGYIGGVAVFDGALTPAQMVRLADIHRSGVIEVVGPTAARLCPSSYR